MEDGFLLIDKQVDWTSRDICNKVGHLLHNKKVGHTGTLDPFATGLMIVGVGKATKALSFLEDSDKEYVATLKLGIKTDSGDYTGQVIEEANIPFLNKKQIEDILSSFVGEQNQIPPMKSALKVNGQKLYDLARKGVEIERKPRKIFIKFINLLSYQNDEIVFFCHVSKGTYIRTLGEDIAQKLGTVGHLTALRRTKINDFSVEESTTINNVNNENLISIFSVLSKKYPVILFDERKEIKARNGVSFTKSEILCDKSAFLVVSKDNSPIAIYELVSDNFICKRGLW